MEERPSEIKQVSKRNVWVGKNRFYLGEDNILYGEAVGEADDEMGIILVAAINKFKTIVKQRNKYKIFNIIHDFKWKGYEIKINK